MRLLVIAALPAACVAAVFMIGYLAGARKQRKLLPSVMRMKRLVDSLEQRANEHARFGDETFAVIASDMIAQHKSELNGSSPNTKG